MRILVVDDEKLLVKGIKFNLENEGYTVFTAYDGEEALAKIKDSIFDLVILDLMLPKMDGFEVCRAVREFSNVPIIMLTAKSGATDKLLGFEFGADDYLAKPFDIFELKARVRAILRRSQIMSSNGQSTIIKGGNLKLDAIERTVLCDGNAVELTTKEFDLLVMLMKRAGEVFSRETLLNTVWGHDSMGDIRTVDVHIRRLREKLEKNPAEPVYILTKWGVGYYFKK